MRFYFDLHNGDGPTRDDEGVDLASRDIGSQEISRILLDVARDEIPAGDRLVISLTVRDEAGRPISVASLIFSNEWIG